MNPIHYQSNDRVPWGRFLSVFFLLLTIACHTNVFSQNYYRSTSNILNGNDQPNFLRLNEINRHAAKHFRDFFSTEGTEKWIKENDCYIANYKEGNSQVNVYYNIHGDFKYSTKAYGMQSLNKEISKTVLQKFSDYNIKMVLEITDLQKSIYFIKLANTHFIKTVKFQEGRMELMETFINGGADGQG